MSWRSRIVQVLGVELTGARAIDGLHWVVCAIPDGSEDMSPEEWGWGVKTTKYEAATVAVAELVERTIMESGSQFGLVYASAGELGESDWLSWPSPHGRASDGLLDSSFDDVKIHWVEGCEFEVDARGEFVFGKRRFVPAHMVFVHSDESDPLFSESWEFRNQSSVGWAVHTDRQVALKKAYCEVVEHHVKMLYFFAGCLGEEFSFAADHYLYDSCEVLRQRGMRIFVYRMPGGGVDVYNAYLESSGVPWLIAGSGNTPEKAFTEAIMLAKPKLYDKMCKDVGFSRRDEITDIDSRVAYWACSKRRPPREVLRPGTIPERCLVGEDVVLRSPGFMVDLSEGLADEVGLHAVKVVYPSSLIGLFRESKWHGWQRLANTYLNENEYTPPAIPHPY